MQSLLSRSALPVSWIQLLGTLACLASALGVSVAKASVQTTADRFVLTENASALTLRPLANDRIPAAELAGGALTILRAPALGTATVDGAGTPTTAADDALVYTPGVDRSGEDSLRYRICGGGNCAEGEVALVIRPVSAGLAYTVTNSGGFRDVPVTRLRALPSARFQTTRLAAPQISEYPLAIDPAPQNPFSGNAALSLRVLPSASTAREWRVLADARSLSTGNVDIYLGVDSNRDGLASADELRCAAGMSSTSERCEMAVSVPACGNLAYWMLVVNAGAAAHTARVETFEVPTDSADGSLAATGPGQTAAGAAFPIRLSWFSPKLVDASSQVGYVTVMSASGTSVGSFPVRFDRSGREESGIALANGSEMAVRIPAGATADRVYIDVPAGATSLQVVSRASEGVGVYLARVAAPVASAAIPSVAAAPGLSGAAISAPSASATQSLVASGTTLAPGRWYVVPVNSSTRPADVVLKATISGTAPVVRPGGYFNPGRSGHGLFIYPAGTEWAGLWYTYLEDGTPTWYYLQGPAPSAQGQWAPVLYRSAWDGTRNALTAVGRATTTPTAADAFTFSYRLDGQSGSEAFASFGRGCPSLSGAALNASSHWFNPVRSGTGYSVQLFSNYEFYAAFVYDAMGVPRFLVAENPSFAGSTASVPLAQLRGFCPLCTRAAAPTRTTVGSLSRTFVGGALTSLSLDATYTSPVSGRWQVTDSVQPLGGATSLQGCAP